ncbi:hypothetical protein BOX15_Mlig005122g1 [Macrostomum lignano]|uniref:C2H2-type domain-containing protein n=1 Tax=Macrostomum lignano TaxID=282301 RepID=A0A267ELG5_9PLAT|nr:hypothetical protein BOX15_Mlig005122g1 [Macrostomum lignano]
MGRKKKKQLKPWCWYCNREFEDEKILIDHQKAKHFKCHVCHRKLFTGPGLVIHCGQVHKEKVEQIPNAVQGRTSVEIEIYGMQGVPEEDQEARRLMKRGQDPEAEQQQPPEKKKKQPQDQAAWLPPNIPMPPPGLPFPPPPVAMPFGSSMPPPPPPPPPPPLLQPFSAPTTVQHPHFPPPPRPLVPSAAVPSSSVASSSVHKQPNLGLTSDLSTYPRVAKPWASGANAAAAAGGLQAKLIHPDEDISLEERRACLGQFKLASGAAKKTGSGGQQPVVAAVSTSSSLSRPPPPLMPPAAPPPLMPRMPVSLPSVSRSGQLAPWRPAGGPPPPPPAAGSKGSGRVF